MSQLTGTSIKKAILGLFSGLDSTDEALLNNLLTRVKARCYLSDLATAGTAQTETGFFVNDTGCTLRLITAKLIVPIAVTADATDKNTTTLTKRDAAGINNAVMATSVTDVAGGSLVAFLPKVLTNTVANTALPDGWVLTALVSKAGNGKAFTAATSQAYLEVLLEPEA